MSLGSMAMGALQGFAMTGNPVGAIVGGVAGAVGGAGSPTAAAGNIGNTLANGTDAAFLAAQQAINNQNQAYQLALNKQSSDFDNMTNEKSELMRESNTLRDVAMKQREADNTITKDFIKSIG